MAARADVEGGGRSGTPFLVLSLAAWIGSIPLSALYFNLFSPISPLANLIAVPLGTFALMAHLGALLCVGRGCHGSHGRWDNAAWFLYAGNDVAGEWSTRIPGQYCGVACRHGWRIGIYFGVLILQAERLAGNEAG